MTINKEFLAELLTSTNVWGWEVKAEQISDKDFEKFESDYSKILKTYPDFEPDDMDYQGDPDDMLVSSLEEIAKSMGESLFGKKEEIEESVAKAIDGEGLFVEIGSEISDDKGNKGYVVDIIGPNKISVEFDEGNLDDGTYNSKFFTICEAKKDRSVYLPNCNLLLYGWGVDINGNKIIKIGYPNQRAFSIQTNNGGLKFSNSRSFDKTTKLSDLEDSDLEKICDEVYNYIEKFGSKEQKSKLKVYNKKVEESLDGEKDKDADIRTENFNKIKSLFGKQNSYSSAGWGGISVWALKDNNSTGIFLVVDDNDNVAIVERTFNEERDENEDEDIMLVSIDDDIDGILDKAMSIKSGKIVESKGFDIEDVASILYDLRSFGLVDQEKNYQKLLDYLESKDDKLGIPKDSVGFGNFVFDLYERFGLGVSPGDDEVKEAISDRIKEMIEIGESKKPNSESPMDEYKRKAKERFSKAMGKSKTMLGYKSGNGEFEYSVSDKASKQNQKNFSTKGGSLMDEYKKDAKKRFDKAFSKVKESKSDNLDISVSIMEDILLSKHLTKLGIEFERNKADNIPNGIRYEISCSAKERTSLEDYLEKVGYKIKINESRIKEDNSKAYRKSGHKDFVKLLSKYKLSPEMGKVTGEESQEYFFPDNAEKELEKFGYSRLKKDKVTDKGDKNFGKSGYFVTYNWVNESIYRDPLKQSSLEHIADMIKRSIKRNGGELSQSTILDEIDYDDGDYQIRRDEDLDSNDIHFIEKYLLGEINESIYFESSEDIITIDHDQNCSFVGQIGGSCFLTAGTKVKVLSNDGLSKTVKILDGSFKGDVCTISSITNESKSLNFRKPIILGVSHFINEAKIKKDYMLEITKKDGFDREYFEDINDMNDALESLSEEEAKNYKTYKRDNKGQYKPITESKDLKLSYIGKDSWGRKTYKGSDDRNYVGVDDEIYSTTTQGEPSYPITNYTIIFPITESKDDFDAQLLKVKNWFDSKYDSSHDFAFDGNLIQVYNGKKLVESLDITTI